MPRLKAPRSKDVTIWFTVDELEHRVRVPAGVDRWDVVARATSQLLGCPARAEEPPTYDTGTRNWTLTLTLSDSSFWGTETVPVPVRWN